MASVYEELDEVLQVGSEPFAGPVTWRMALAAIVGGALGVALLGGWGFVLGAVLGLLATVPVRGVPAPVRVWLLVRCVGVARQPIDLGTADTAHLAGYVVRVRRDGVVRTIVRRGDV